MISSYAMLPLLLLPAGKEGKMLECAIGLSDAHGFALGWISP